MKTAASVHQDNAASRRLSCRPRIKAANRTVRDGGLMNHHDFEDQIVKVIQDRWLAADCNLPRERAS